MENTSDFSSVMNLVSKTITPLEAKTILNAKLSIDEILELKQYYANLFNVNIDDKQTVLKYGLIFLVGLPSSGKTTFSNLLLQYYKSAIIHINQDEIGREGCYDVLCKYAKKKNITIILDRCNLTRIERNEWISCYKNISTRNVLCVYFNLDKEICKQRLEKRQNHDMRNPTVIDNLSSKLEIPRIDEGFSKIIEITDDDEIITNIFEQFGIKYVQNCLNYGLKKFIRTKHIVNLGSMSRDDLIWQGKELENFLKQHLVVEEKIDGANLGIFIDETNKIIIQNRSHYIYPEYHKQFADINKWKYQHEYDIYNVIGNNKWIIYGEWVVAKHSIHYTNLPDKFILFDIYDRITNEFFSRSKIESLIDGTSFVQIRKIADGLFSLNDLKKLAYSQSSYYNGPVEGIYVRSFNDDNTCVKYRGKIVRDNFLESGQNHWSKTEIIKNIIK